MDEEEELPCLRDIEEDGTWWCINDHTGCLYNDGHNGCNHPGKSICPLERETKEVEAWQKTQDMKGEIL